MAKAARNVPAAALQEAVQMALTQAAPDAIKQPMKTAFAITGICIIG
jgi:hypothetical protein